MGGENSITTSGDYWITTDKQDQAEPEDAEDRENAREETALFAQMSTLLAAHGLVVPNPFKPEAPKARVSVFVTDHLGTPLRLVDHNGKTRWAGQPDDWAAVAEENGIRQPIRFQGQWLDEESGLYYNRYRYYDPKQGRYVTQDPIGLMGGVNIYGYVRANPVSKTDPTGLVEGYAQAGYGASIMAGLLGGSISGGVCTTGKEACTYQTVCIRVGLGVYAGYGGQVGGGLVSSGIGDLGGGSLGIGGDLGAGPSAGGGASVGIPNGGAVGGAKGRGGAGVGVDAGVDMCYTWLQCK
ncbi:RHS domain-containing protein [Azoarcus sp. L1K30]|uniref:RHS repeat-associated core domain-containing protein n=1 Tax=Azoarcus sp. L1K30 TaxID=2820277 RepID=UPI001B82099E|nr:RHS repeat-associated core domain-containing protein [Azoarcus sp. L1K30]MBR0566162.1 RHS domain-containing protein [Azoarcus sp. L1K30]